jgi:hypothetical protein
MSTFVLVHGTWNGRWCWKKLTPPDKKGLPVLCAGTLRQGERIHTFTPNMGLSVHIQDIVNLIEFEDPNYVILVGHS